MATLLALACLPLVAASPQSPDAAPLPQPRFLKAPGSPLLVGPMAGRPVVADLNGDGHRDVIVGCGTCCGSRPEPESGKVVVLLGDGRGRLRPAGDEPRRIGPSSRKVAVADLDGDGKPDVVVAEHDAPTLSLLRGDGKGGLAPFATPRVSIAPKRRPHTHDVAIADLNGDGKPDLCATNCNDGTIAVLLGDGRGGFAMAPGAPVAAGRHPYDSIAVCDVDGDGKPDLLAPDLLRNRLVVLRGAGDGTFAPLAGTPLPLGPRPGYLSAGDVDGDGHDDVVVSHDDDALVVVLLGDGKGGFRQASSSPLCTPEPVWGSAIGDVNGDGKPDLVLGTMGASAHVHVLLGDGKGGFEPAACSPLAAGAGCGYVALADLDEDGRLDVVTGDYRGGSVTVLLQAGAPDASGARGAPLRKLDAEAAFARLRDATSDAAAREAAWSWALGAWQIDALGERFAERARQRPGDARARLELGRAFGQQCRAALDVEQKQRLGARAEDELARAVALDPASWDARFEHAALLAAWPATSGKQDAALRELLALLADQEKEPAQRPEFAAAYVELARLYESQGKAADAKAIKKRGAERFPARRDLR